jgi:formylmethanofuran dehydrogenase subunit E
MLVPIELYSLTQRMGHLSPDLAIGWQIGKYVHEFFDGLQEVRIAAAAEGDAVFALSYLAREHGCYGQVTMTETPRPWDFLFYHAITGTALHFTLIRKHIELSQGLRSLESHLAMDKPAVVEIYRTGLDLLVESILKRPVDSFCKIRQIRCRPLPRTAENNSTIRCCRCGKLSFVQNAWDIEGQICCQACSGLEPAWFMYH